MSSLMAALHEARALINEGIAEVDHRNRWVAQLVTRHRTNPDQIAELYDVAGMIGPGGSASVDGTRSGYLQPHAKAVTQRVMAVLRDGPQTAQEMSQQLGAKVGTVLTAINRLRERGAQIEGVSCGGGGRTCRYTLRTT